MAPPRGLLREEGVSFSVQAPPSTLCQPALSMNPSRHLQVQLQGYAFSSSPESSENMLSGSACLGYLSSPPPAPLALMTTTSSVPFKTAWENTRAEGVMVQKVGREADHGCVEARARVRDQRAEALTARCRQYSKSNADSLGARKPKEGCLFCCWLVGFCFYFDKCFLFVVLALLGLTM